MLKTNECGVSIDEIKKQYPVGTLIRLIEMKNDPYPLSPGTIGTVRLIDSLGTIHMAWSSNKGTLGLIAGLDEFEIIDSI